jgi:aspartate/methionine/tyrosine aminotransferase
VLLSPRTLNVMHYKENPSIHIGHTISSVQTPIIPVIGEWTRSTPGTLSLGQGMVSYPPPAAAMQAIRDFGSRQEEHLYGSPLGYGRLLELIELKLHSENGIDCTSGYRIMVTAGSNMAFLNILLAIADPGDEIILPLPYYFNQEMAVRMLNCTPVAVPTDINYQLQLDALRAAITEKTRAIVTVSPNNPSGAVYPEAMLRAVNQLCREHGLYHISDEAYEYFTYGNAQHFSPGSISDAEHHTISLYSLSKAYGFASWRIGYVVIPEELLTSLLKVQDTNLICPPLITQYAAIGALETGSSYCKSQLQVMSRIRALVTEQLQSLKGVQFINTEGAFYLLLKLDTRKNDLQLVKSLISEFKIAVIPGCAFGLYDACYLRVSYGMLDEGTARIATQRLVEGLGKLC